jgi:NADH:ubiquinone oxidoreductase subunit F (NADH-binding)
MAPLPNSYIDDNVPCIVCGEESAMVNVLIGRRWLGGKKADMPLPRIRYILGEPILV